MKRQPKTNEVDNLRAKDGKTVFSIRVRKDANFEFYVEHLQFDTEEGVHYWSQEMLPRPSLFGSVDEAKAEIFAQFSHIIISN